MNPIPDTEQGAAGLLGISPEALETITATEAWEDQREWHTAAQGADMAVLEEERGLVVLDYAARTVSQHAAGGRRVRRGYWTGEPVQYESAPRAPEPGREPAIGVRTGGLGDLRLRNLGRTSRVTLVRVR